MMILIVEICPVTVADVNSQLVVQDYTYQKDGAAVPSEEESDIAVFTNGYEVQPTEAVLGVVKQVYRRCS